MLNPQATVRGTLTRKEYADQYVLGVLEVFSGPVRIYACRTLELPWKDNQRGVSCVPAGVYPVDLEYSPHFDRDLYELKHVPGRSEVKIHVANYVRQLEGCIAVGLAVSDINKDGLPDMMNSRLALARLHAALDGKDRWELTIVGDGRDKIKAA